MDNLLIDYVKNQLHKHSELKYQIVINEWQTDFLRFYKSQTNYNITKSNFSLDISLYKGKKNYSFSLDQPDNNRFDVSFRKALEIIDILPDDPDFVDVEDNLVKSRELQKDNNIEALPLEAKILFLKTVAARAETMGFEIFGTYICNYQHQRIINSNCLDKQQWNSPVFLEIKAVSTQNQVTVLQSFGGESITELNPDDFIASFQQKMQNAMNPVIDIEPGEYKVILAPRCIAEFLQYMSYGMSARSYDQKSSYFQDMLNKKVFPEFITVKDDPESEHIISYDYNGDGHIYKPLTLIDRGVFVNFMCSNYYAHKTGLPKNGNTGACLSLQTGDRNLDDLITSIDKGLYISSLHYMNFINEKDTSVTGLTRDGTFLIENGRITKVVNNLRFTEKLVRIFQNIVFLENRSEAVPFSDNYEFFDINTTRAPHVLVKNFNITSSTQTI